MKEQPGLVLKLETIQKMEGVKENNFTNYSLKTYTIKKIKEAVELKLKEDQYQVTTSD
jgi:23S rRNA maturation-related 3'-5' exoribonuclease YhaM